jgi:hypothetical protein
MSDPIISKLGEAQKLLKELEKLDSIKEFQPKLNAFLAAARSVLYIAGYQYGLEHRKGNQIVGLSAQDKFERQKFDSWCKNSKTYTDVLAHTLTEERNEVMHRSGQAGFYYIPKPIYGLAVEAGTALMT